MTTKGKPFAYVMPNAYSVLLNEQAAETLARVRLELQVLDAEHSGQVMPPAVESVLGWIVESALRRSPEELAREIWEHNQRGGQ